MDTNKKRLPKEHPKEEAATKKPAGRARTETKPVAKPEPVARKKAAAKPSVEEVGSPEESPASKKSAAAKAKKSADVTTSPAPKRTKKATEPMVEAVPVVAAEPAKSVPLFGKKKPDALKSLAELVEEDKLNPKPRPPKPKPSPKSKLEPPASDVETAGAGPSSKGKADRPSRRRQSSNQTPSPQQPAESIEETTEVFGDLVVIWRTGARPVSENNSKRAQGDRQNQRGKKRTPVAAEVAEEEPIVTSESKVFGDDLVVQFRRPGRGKSEPKSGGRSRLESKVEPAVEPIPEPEPVIPVRPAIPIPVDAPQIVLRNGLPTIVRDHRVYPPIAFFGSAPDERRANTILAQVRRATDAGVHLHSLLVEFEVSLSSVESSVKYAAYMANRVIEIDPEAQILFRVVFAAPRQWESQYPKAKYTSAAGRLAEPSVCDDEFWSEGSNCLTEFISRLRALPLGGHVLGVHLDRGEWFFPEGHGYDTSPSATQAFREWLRTRYVDDLVALRAAWFDGTVTFDSVNVPAFASASQKSDFMRINRRERRWVDYHLFLSDATCARIAELAYAAKAASEGYFLVGVSYGYTFEWSHPSSGHLSLGKLLRTREIDFIAGPPSYRSREPGGDAPFPCPIDSLQLNGKLYLSEEDFKTSIGDHKEPDDYNPTIKTPQALEALHWRGAGAALTHGSGMYWMDLWGNGWLNTSTIWDRGARISEALVKRMASNPPDPEVAVFIDERALAYLIDEHSFALLVQDVRESMLRSGLSAGFYLLSDLAHRENFPECKLYVFLNAWDIRPEHRLAIKNRLQRDGKVLFWLYCAGMFDNGRESLERAREVTGIAIKPQPFHSRTGTTILSKRHPLCDAFAGQGLIGGANVDPSYFAIPESSVVLGEYSQSGLPSFVIRDFNEDPDTAKHWKSVFLGEPFVTPGLLRALAQIAGCHIWNYTSDVVHVRPPFLAVHCSGTSPRAIALPRNWEAYDLIEQRWVAEDANTIRFSGQDGSTHLFLVGLRHDIESLIHVDPEQFLHMENLPERVEDSGHDAMTFDVPIMRLDEVFEEMPDEVGDEWFLKPGMIEIEDEPVREEPSTDHKVVRRRRNRNGRRRESERSTGEAYDSELGMGVMFRKRE